jgi:hypothetical protein
VFGYELVPDRATRIYTVIGCNENGVPVVRMTSYGPDAPNTLRLAAVNGQAVTRGTPGTRHIQQRDSVFSEWPSAVASAWAQLAIPSSGRLRRHVELNETAHRYLDAALAIAHSHLAAWDPFIRFFGLPKEAQQGFPLHGAAGEHGELVSQRPDMWILRWKSSPHVIYEEWSVTLPDQDAATGLTRA